MKIHLGFEIVFQFQTPVAMMLMLRIHPSREVDLLSPEKFHVSPLLTVRESLDTYGNRRGRVFAPAGYVAFSTNAIITDTGIPDLVVPDAVQHDVDELPEECMSFLLASRYCEVDSDLNDFAWRHFGNEPAGWQRVQSVCDFVHRHLRFDYMLARANRTAREAYQEGVGVCRDFAHLAITLCRCLNIPARYATGYLGDIGVPAMPDPMDFSAWIEVYLGGRWHIFDPRHNERRIGRVLMARGRDAADVALTTTFGPNHLASFKVWTDEIP